MFYRICWKQCSFLLCCRSCQACCNTVSQDLRAEKMSSCWENWAWAFYMGCNDAVLARLHLINSTPWETEASMIWGLSYSYSVHSFVCVFGLYTGSVNSSKEYGETTNETYWQKPQIPTFIIRRAVSQAPCFITTFSSQLQYACVKTLNCVNICKTQFDSFSINKGGEPYVWAHRSQNTIHCKTLWVRSQWLG